MPSLARAVLHGLAGSRGLQALATRYGVQPRHGLARRFVAGETPADAIAVARSLAADRLGQSLAYLAGQVTTSAAADSTTRAALAMLPELAGAGIDRHLSVSLPQYGLLVDRATALDNMRRLLGAGAPHGFVAYIDMESSRHVQAIMDIFDTLWQLEYRNVGLAVQAYLLRSAADVERLNRLGVRVRLVKGGFHESRRIAHRSKTRVDAAYIDIMQQLLLQGTTPAFATHDPRTIAAITGFASTHGIARDRFEFHLLYGIRRDLQLTLAAEGYQVRVLVPFGPDWFPYLMRRLGERPANIGFVLRSLVRERKRK